MFRRRFAVLSLTVVLVSASIVLFGAFRPNGITLDFGSEQITITEADLQGGWFNYDAKQALTHGKDWYSRALTVSDPDSFTGAFPDLVQYCDRLAPRFETAAYDGQVHFHPHQQPQFTVTNQQPGRVIDREQLYRDLLAVLKGNHFPHITVNYRAVAPTPADQIVANITKRSQFSTRCSVNPDRETNIALALKQFDGLVVAPGETVSFNQVVGARTAANGYQTAKIIVKGEYVDGIGGGVCQVSTTVFNAAVAAGLQILESHNHTLPSSYIPVGQDAMVSSAADLRFANNTGAPIYFATQFQNHTLTVTVYGRSKGPNVSYRLTTATTKTLPVTDTTDPDLPAATLKDVKAHPDQYERVLKTAGKPGYVVNTYLETRQGNRCLSKKLLRRSTYQATPNVYTYRPVAPAPAFDDTTTDF